jgi:hypothetical protein
VVGSFEYGNKPSGSIKGGAFIDKRSSRHQITCLKATAKSYNVATRTAEPRRAKTVQNSQRSKAINAVQFTLSCGRGGGVKSFGGLQACNLVTVATTAERLLASEECLLLHGIDYFR